MSQKTAEIALLSEVLGKLGRLRTKALRATMADRHSTLTVQLYLVASLFYIVYMAFPISVLLKAYLLCRGSRQLPQPPSPAVEQPSSQSSSTNTARLAFQYQYLAFVCPIPIPQKSIAFHADGESNDIGKVLFMCIFSYLCAVD